MVIENLALEISKKDKNVDILVLSAGIINSLSPVDSINLREFKDIINLNYLANFRMVKNFHLLLKNSKVAKLAVVSSIKESAKDQYWGIYQPIMTALNELMLTYANENSNSKLKVNIYSPKAVNTKFREITMPGEDKSIISSPLSIGRKIVKHLLSTNNSSEIIKIN